MTNLQKIRTGSMILKSIRDFVALSLLLTSIICSVLVLQQYQIDKNARDNYEDCMSSLILETSKNDNRG